MAQTDPAPISNAASAAVFGLSPLPVQGRPSARREEVASKVKDYILANKLSPGDLLPTETELCAAIGASRSSVREAIKMLSALDIVEVRHGHGTFVGRMSLSALIESLTFRGLLSGEEDHHVLAQVVEVRQTLEQGLAASIIAGLDEPQRQELSTLAEQMVTAATEGDDFIEVDRQFHLKLMEPLGNDLILQLTGAFWQVQAVVAPTLEVEPPDRRLTANLHVAIVAALTSGDVAATRSAIEAHYAPIRAAIASATGAPAIGSSS